MTGGLTIKNMTLADVQTVLGWAASEGWNPGAADAEAFLAADPDGFFLARLNADPVAAISVVNHNAENAFLGLYICPPERRGLGFGLAIWAHAIVHAGGRSIGLDGVPEQQGNYRKSGFVRTGQTLRYMGRIAPKKSPNVRGAKTRDYQRLATLDAKANGFDRPNFIRAWVTPFADLRASRVLIRDREVKGFATWRVCAEGTKIGPLVADDTNSALELISDVAFERAENPLIIDIPERNGSLRQELENAGFTVPFVTARMYRGRAPEPHVSLQAIATMELG